MSIIVVNSILDFGICSGSVFGLTVARMSRDLHEMSERMRQLLDDCRLAMGRRAFRGCAEKAHRDQGGASQAVLNLWTHFGAAYRAAT